MTVWDDLTAAVNAAKEWSDNQIQTLEDELKFFTGSTLWGASQQGPNFAAFNAQVVRLYAGKAGVFPAWPTNFPGIIPILSFKLLPSNVLAGDYDSALASFFSSAPTRAYWDYWHEPEDDIEAGTFMASDYASAYRHIAAIAKANQKSTLLRCALILMGWTTDPASHRNWRDYYPGDDVIDVIAWDIYLHGEKPADLFDNVVAATKTANKPIAIAEVGVNNNIPAATRAADLLAIHNDLVTLKPEFVSYFDGLQWQISNSTTMMNAWMGVGNPGV